MTECDPFYSGRPFGGLCIVVKKCEAFSSREIEIACDRVLAVGLYDTRGTLMQVVVCVYMPFYNGTPEKYEEFVETLDNLQSVVDSFGPSAPVLLLGDFNAQLPSKTYLQKKWYKEKGFNRHSSVLYDFVTGNDLSVADFLFPQTVRYTYFNHLNRHYSWIDHVLCFQRDLSKITQCIIVPEDPGNMSDHLPIQVTFTVPSKPVIKNSPGVIQQEFPIPKWKDLNAIECFQQSLSDRLFGLESLDSSRICTDTLQTCVDNRLSIINSAIHSAAREAGIVPKNSFKPKPFWCPNLSVLRDKKQFWWSIWVELGRPRCGSVFVIWKNLKKQFRRLARHNIQNQIALETSTINQHFKRREMKCFWNKLKKQQQVKTNSVLTADNLAAHFKTVMMDNEHLSGEHLDIKNFVESCASDNKLHRAEVNISPSEVMSMVKSLKQGISPGCDGITTEHLLHGMCPALASTLANLYSVVLSTSTVPSIVSAGLIIPVLKKPSSDPNLPSNYRPITLSSIHSKMIELVIMPNHDINDAQFGFREGRGTTFVTSLINDCAAYYKNGKSAMFLCSLDAEKCFDSIWHHGLMFKLWPILPLHHWLFLYRWYRCTNAAIRWNGAVSSSFSVSRGMRQGSVLSPVLFNIFLDELLQQLQKMPQGIRVFDMALNSCAYADDITLFAATVPGLQCLIDKCVSYSNKFRFRFGFKKSKCMILGKNPFITIPSWKICDQVIATDNHTEILGVTFESNLSYSKHVQTRITSCRQRMYGLTSVGMSYPGLASDTKAYIWNSIGAPMITYAMESIHMTNANIKQLKSAQGAVIKRVMGIPKRSHHTRLLDALKIPTTDTLVNINVQKLYHRIFGCESPAKELQIRFLKNYIVNNDTIPNTLIQRILSQGVSPVKVILNKPKGFSRKQNCDNGITDSLRSMLFHDNYVKIDSNEHLLASLLLRAF